MNSSFACAGFSLVAAVAWGVGDFAGGLAARKSNVFAVVVIADAAGLLLMLALALLNREPLPSARGLLLGALAGLIGGLGLTAFYRCLAIGKVGLNASLTAVLAVAIPVLFGLFLQGFPRPAQLAGLCIALSGILLISLPDSSGGPVRGLGLAMAAGAGFGGFLVLSKLAGDLGLFWILTATRVSSLALIWVILLATERRAMPGLAAWRVSFAAGILDVLGNLFFVLATRSGRLDISAVLSSLYPAVTILLAVVFLRERISLRQGFGVTAALAAVLLLAY